jgi:hypothetical protein
MTGRPKNRADRLVEHSRTIIDQNGTLHLTKDELEKNLKDLKFEHSSAKKDIVRFKQEVQTLKRKRAKDNTPPPPTKPLVRPQSPQARTSASPASASPIRSDFPPLLQPVAKKSRTRKPRWDKAPAIPSSDNVNGLEKTSASKVVGINLSADPVLLAPLTSFRTKNDITDEIETYSKTLKLGRNKGFVFHRDIVKDRVTVMRKALAYIEVIITNICRNVVAKQSANERRGNSVMACLDTLTRRSVTRLRQDT